MSAGCLAAAGIILAAGEASRMGRPKQVLPYAGKTFVGHAVETALAAGLQPVVVVVGAADREVREAIAAMNVEIIENPGWVQGMGSSLSTGVLHLQEIAPDCAAAAVLLVDQPLVTPQQIAEMRRSLYADGADAVAAEYGGSIGVPAIFSRRLFARLAALPPDSGAKKVLLASDIRVLRFPLPEAAIDIDTPADFERLNG